MTLEALTIEAVHQVDAAINGAGPTEDAYLAQVIAVAAGRLSHPRGSTHATLVMSYVSNALRAADERRGVA